MDNKNVRNKKGKITIRRRKFINEIIKGSSGTDAIEKAGYKITTKQSASTRATILKAKPEIKKEIEKSLLKLEIEPEYIIRELKHRFENSSNDTVILNLGKYFFELLGYNKQQQEQATTKLIVNIDKGIIPVNINTDNHNIDK